MVNVLLIMGIVLIIVGFLFRPKKGNQYNASSIEAFQEDFFEQFKISQTKLQSLYAFDFSEVVTKLDEVEGRLDELQGTVSQLSLSKIEQQLAQIVEEFSQNTSSRLSKAKTEPKNTTIMDDKMMGKIMVYLELKNQGKPLDEMVKILQMEKGELLFLENLSKSITNS